MESVWIPLTYICDEIKENVKSQEVKILQELLCNNGESLLRKAFKFALNTNPITKAVTTEVSIYNRMKAYKMWYNLVAKGKKWDHKEVIKVEKGGEWTLDTEREYKFRYDIWSNVHYGFIGLCAGFTKFELSNGAGVAQLKDNIKSSSEWGQQYIKNRLVDIGDADILGAFDDAEDAQAVKVGYSLYEKYGHVPQTLKPRDILHELYIFFENHKPLAIEKCKIRG